MKMFRSALVLFALSLALPLGAQESPEAVYAKWVAASKAGDIQGLLAISSAAKVKEFNSEFMTPEQQAEIRKIMKAMAPINYKIKDVKTSADGNKTSLFLDMTALDFFEMNDPKAKPKKEFAEVRLLKEGGQWKIDQQCSGGDGCGKEPEWIQTSWGKSQALSNGATIKFVKGNKNAFPGIKMPAKPYAVAFTVEFPDGSETFSYFLHRSPTFADFYLSAGEEKLTPVARTEDFPNSLSSEDGKPNVKELEPDYSYSQNTNFKGKGSVTLLFDVSTAPSGDKPFYATVTYAGQKYSYEVK